MNPKICPEKTLNYYIYLYKSNNYYVAYKYISVYLIKIVYFLEGLHCLSNEILPKMSWSVLHQLESRGVWAL